MFGLDFSLAAAVNIVLSGGVAAALAVYLATRASRESQLIAERAADKSRRIADDAAKRSEDVMLRTAKAFETVARHLHQALRDPESVGELNLDEVGFPTGLRQIVFAEDGAKAGDRADVALETRESVTKVLGQPERDVD